VLAIFIIAGEIMFWVLVLGGLVCRYIFQKKKLGAFFLWSTPIVDLVILLVTIVDLRNGGTADFVHGLAAIYIGVTFVFGKSMIDWADKRFAHRYNNGPEPQKPPKYGKTHAKKERKQWIQHLFAWMIGCGLLSILIWVTGDESRTSQLMYTISLWTIILVIDFLISFSYTIWPRENKKEI
jgi:peptidoglycan/LPS O-acetylase OafA/YrhL